MRSSSRVRFLHDAPFERVEGDMRDADSLVAAVRGVQAVVHLAGLTSALSPSDYELINARGSADLARAASEAGVERFVYCSSLAAQGPSPDGRPQPPETALPVSVYGRTKLGGEVAVRAERERMNVSILRLPVVYGPRDRGLLPFYQFAKYGFLPIYGNGINLLTWVHARDAAASIVAALERSRESGSVYTVSDGHIYTWRELGGTLGRVFGKNLRLIGVPGPLFLAGGSVADVVSRVTKRSLPLTSEKVIEMSQSAWVCDNSRISAELGWQPCIGAEEGVAETYRWYRANRWL
jgi:nucleoside-diphosphate-sugar epimerase